VPSVPFCYSRSDKQNGRDNTGKGWTDEGINYYNDTCKKVIRDRHERGEDFNAILYQTIEDRLKAKRRSKKGNASGGGSVREEVVPYDDLQGGTNHYQYNKEDSSFNSYSSHRDIVATKVGQYTPQLEQYDGLPGRTAGSI